MALITPLPPLPSPRAGRAPLLALPAALCIASPAWAQTTITQDQGGEVNLDALGGAEIGAGVSITASGGAAISASLPAQLVNHGLVADTEGVGVRLGGGGGLINTGGVYGANAVDLAAAGSVTNSGVIHAGHYGVRVNGGAGTVSNSGQIGAGYDGVSLNQGGSVTNTGLIFGGHIGVYTGNGLGVVQNSGTISAQSGDAVSLYSGGAFTNTATGMLAGGYSGVYAGGSGSSITNAGQIGGRLFGVYLMGDATVTNSGVIAGGTDGVIDINPGGVLANTGLIHGGQTGVQFAEGGTLDNAGRISGGVSGVALGKAGTLTNEAGGVISGGAAGVAAGAGSVIVNAGSIAGATGILATGPVSIENEGVIAAPGGAAISLQGGASQIMLGTGTQIEGIIAGNGTASAITLAGQGSLATSITGLAAGRLTVQPGAAWTASGNWTVGQVVNAGTLQAGLAGTPLSIAGDFTQTQSGTLRVLVTPAGMNQLNVTGTAHLGGTLAYVLAPGTYAPGTYTFLTAGAVSGAFAQVRATDAASLTRDGNPGTGPAGGPSVGAALAPPAPAPANETNEEAASLAAPASADPVGSAAPAPAASAALTLAQPMVVAPGDDRLFANAAQSMALSGTELGQTLLAHAGQAEGQGCAAGLAPQGNQTGNAAAALASGLCRMGGWLAASGGDLSTDGAYDSRGGGFLAGLDHPAGPGRLGAVIGYDSFFFKDEAGGKASVQTVRLGLYGGLPLGQALLSAAVTDGIADTRTTRATGLGGAAATGHGNILASTLQAARPLAWGEGGRLLPALGLNITRVWLGALTEAAPAALAVRTRANSGVYVAPFLRMSATRAFLTARGLEIAPVASLGLTVNATNPGARVAMTAEDGTIFAPEPLHLSPVSAQLGIGLGMGKGFWRLTLRYDATVAASWHAQTLQGGLLVRF
ncbi:hypothetical protein [Acidocella sp.]|uniref:autotransporter outer membrane beta-barrel domain-containing protein n=1 Tax=Acidocella sp. TaxID=50710 RepID=UPI0026144585|nr:hypothetical protein [Acidocella sp.]